MRTRALFALGVWALGVGGGALAEDLEPGAPATRLRGQVPAAADSSAREPASEAEKTAGPANASEKPEGSDGASRSAVHKRQGAGGRMGM